MEQILMLKKFPLFDKLSARELRKIASRLTEKTYADKEFVCRRGEPGGNLYLIKKGAVAVILPLYRYEEKQEIVTTFKAGMYFGELSFFDGKPCSVDISAQGPVVLLELKRADYEELLAEDPETGYEIQNKIILNLIRTIKRMNEKYSYNAFLN